MQAYSVTFEAEHLRPTRTVIAKSFAEATKRASGHIKTLKKDYFGDVEIVEISRTNAPIQ